MKASSIWKLLKSMKFAVWILVILAVVSLLSMFFVEFFPINKNLDNWEAINQQRYGVMFPVMKVLQLHDPYRSWWYQSLLGILTLGLTLCIIDRLPKSIKQAFGNKFDFNSKQVESYSNHCSLTFDSDISSELPILLKGYKLRFRNLGNKTLIAADKNRLHYLGPVLIHTGLLLLAIGGFIAIWGTTVFKSGFPGDVIQSEKFDFQVRIDDFKIEYYPLGVGQWALVDDKYFGKIVKKLENDKFRVKFSSKDEGEFFQDIESTRIKNKFNIQFDQSNIQDYICELTILEGGQEVISKVIEVNKPLRYKGFRFYQNSFDYLNPRVIASADCVAIRLLSKAEQTPLDTIYVELGEKYQLPNGTFMTLADFQPDFRWSDERAYSASEEMLNPAVKLTIYDAEELKTKIDFAPISKNYTVKKGDCLWKIAGMPDIYGDPYKWPRIWSANAESISNPDLIYPHQLLKIITNLEPEQRLNVEIYHKWLFLLHEFHNEPENAQYSFMLWDIVNPKASIQYRTTLEVKENQGVSVIWVGFICGTLGLLISFYLTPSHLRAITTNKENKYSLIIGGYSTKNKQGFQEHFKRIINKLIQKT